LAKEGTKILAKFLLEPPQNVSLHLLAKSFFAVAILVKLSSLRFRVCDEVHSSSCGRDGLFHQYSKTKGLSKIGERKFSKYINESLLGAVSE